MVTINRLIDLDHLVSTAALQFIDVVAAAQAPSGGVHGDGVARVVLTGGGAGWIRLLLSKAPIFLLCVLIGTVFTSSLEMSAMFQFLTLIPMRAKRGKPFWIT